MKWGFLAEETGELPSAVLVFIIAALNEEAGIGFTLSELRKLPGDPYLLVVDGNSSDCTVKVARDHKAEIILQVGEKGKGAAISQGLEHLKEQGLACDFLAFIDADYTYPAEHVRGMIEVLKRMPPSAWSWVTGSIDGMIIEVRYLGSSTMGSAC